MTTSRESGRKGGLTSPTVPSPEDFKNPLKVEAGRKGGQTTLARYGSDQLADWGKLGGRPRTLTYDEIRQQRRRERNDNHKEGMGPPSKNLRTLNARYKLRRRSTGIDETPQAGTAQETPREQVPAGKEAR